MVCTLGTWYVVGAWEMQKRWLQAGRQEGGKGATDAEPCKGFWILIQGRGESWKAFKQDGDVIRFLLFKTWLWSCIDWAKRGSGTLTEATTVVWERWWWFERGQIAEIFRGAVVGTWTLSGSGDVDLKTDTLSVVTSRTIFLQLWNFQLRTSHDCGSDTIHHHSNGYTSWHAESVVDATHSSASRQQGVCKD